MKIKRKVLEPISTPKKVEVVPTTKPKKKRQAEVNEDFINSFFEDEPEAGSSDEDPFPDSSLEESPNEVEEEVEEVEEDEDFKGSSTRIASQKTPGLVITPYLNDDPLLLESTPDIERRIAELRIFLQKNKLKAIDFAMDQMAKHIKEGYTPESAANIVKQAYGIIETSAGMPQESPIARAIRAIVIRPDEPLIFPGPRNEESPTSPSKTSKKSSGTLGRKKKKKHSTGS